MGIIYHVLSCNEILPSIWSKCALSCFSIFENPFDWDMIKVLLYIHSVCYQILICHNLCCNISIMLQILHSCYTRVSPSAEVDNPQLVAWSDSVAELLDLDKKE